MSGAVTDTVERITSRRDPRVEVTLYAYVGGEGAHTLDAYLERGGYDAARRALAMDPGEVVDLVKASGLRGRGGAGFPAGVKWSFMPPPDGRDRYVVCNADESEPGTPIHAEYVHRHLPKLAAAGYVLWDERTHEIGRGPRFHEVEAFLEVVQTHSERLPDGWV